VGNSLILITVSGDTAPGKGSLEQIILQSNSRVYKTSSELRFLSIIKLIVFGLQYNYFDPIVPKDSLDLILKEEYDHHRDWWKSKAEQKVQIESINGSHG